MRRLISPLALLVAVLMAALPATVPAPSSADGTAGPCVWEELDRRNKQKVCGPIFQQRYGTTVSDGLSVYNPPGANPYFKYFISFENKDMRTVKGCSWIRVTLRDTAEPFSFILPGSKVCGGESAYRQLDWRSGTTVAGNTLLPGVLRFKQCARGHCFTFAKQRISNL